MRNSKLFLASVEKKNTIIKAMFLKSMLFVFLVCFTTCKTPINGCTDSSAINYNSKATEDDGSCIYGGQLVFWTSTTIPYSPGNVDSVFVNGTYVGAITVAYPSAPACYSNGCYTYNAAAATYTWKNKLYRNFSLTTTGGASTIVANNCTTVKVY